MLIDDEGWVSSFSCSQMFDVMLMIWSGAEVVPPTHLKQILHAVRTITPHHKNACVDLYLAHQTYCWLYIVCAAMTGAIRWCEWTSVCVQNMTTILINNHNVQLLQHGFPPNL